MIRLYKRWLACNRLRTIHIQVLNHLYELERGCKRITSADDTKAYAIYRDGVFGSPILKEISKPDNVVLSENENRIIVKDGYVYELTKR